MKKHNFYAGPSILPEIVYEKTKEAIDDLYGSGVSLMSISHRSKEFQEVMDEAQDLFKELLGIPEGYHVLFLGGGASSQFYMIPFNLMKTKAAYLNTGTWAKKAIKEAKLFGEVVEVASSADKGFNYIPRGFEVPGDVDYMHVTTNNTIAGTEIREDFDFGVTLVADMSSDILSRPVDVSKYGIIYGGAQKNLGPAGVTFVIVKEDILGKVEREIPTMIDYRTHIAKGSMFNTPPVLPVFSVLQTLKWLKGLGGVEVMQKMNEEKAKLLYDEIDRNKLFKPGVPDPADRSLMNITFVMNDEYKDLDKDFLALAAERNIVGIKGHRSVGGFRASTYNALPKESVEVLVKAMQDFEKSV
ncbi:MAG TPA: 3-phosphoserine/phosphohydroxythreonine transaminase [Bacteroidetes bacterium]|nr:3-phosphoserine/phosphohydroxythreonine transaminase [Bacteroidota bacterium]